jgi:hypothetical protein
MDFPNSPTLDQTYTYGIQTYSWNGTAWRLVRTSAVGPTGPTGAPGLDSTAHSFESLVDLVNSITNAKFDCNGHLTERLQEVAATYFSNPAGSEFYRYLNRE